MAEAGRAACSFAVPVRPAGASVQPWQPVFPPRRTNATRLRVPRATGQLQRTLACTEVVLSHAGHEAWSRLFSAAEKRVATAEQMLQQAEQELQSCTPPAPPPPSPITSQKVKYQAETLFDFDKSMLKPEGRAKLDDLAAKIKGIDLEVIVATGHTDRIGTDKYNDGLSARRAQAVKAYLVHRGIDAKRTYTEAKGKRNPVTTG